MPPKCIIFVRRCPRVPENRVPNPNTQVPVYTFADFNVFMVMERIEICFELAQIHSLYDFEYSGNRYPGGNSLNFCNCEKK